MRRAAPIRIKRPKVEAEPFEPVAPSSLLEVAGIVAFMAFFVAVLILNIPEPMDCGVDRDAPTIEEGCP